MLWWMWIVLWVALVLIGALFLAVVGFRVFRRGVRTFADLGEAMDRLAVTPPAVDTVPAASRGVPGIVVPAVFSVPDEVRAAREHAGVRRADDRRSRRVELRARRRQPQLLQDMPHL